MNRPWGPDILGVLRGIQLVANASLKQQEKICQQKWANSSVKDLVCDNKVVEEKIQSLLLGPPSIQVDKIITETLQRSSMVFEGIKGYIVYYQGVTSEGVNENHHFSDFNGGKEDYAYEIDALLRQQAERDLQQYKNSKQTPSASSNQPIQIIYTEENTNQAPKSLNMSNMSQSEKRSSDQIPTKDTSSVLASLETPPKVLSTPQSGPSHGSRSKTHNLEKIEKKRQQLNEVAKQRAVPSTRLSRMFSFGTLAAGLGVGTIAEITRRSLGLHDAPSSSGATLDKAFLTPANAQRIVNTLCKVRGAALKIGQILSIQDNNTISPEFQEAFERVRQAADFMPTWQVEKVLTSQLGPDWRSKLDVFEDKPFAAASIGQVHYGVLKDGTEVAIKIQYPGVAEGIESDINNLVSVMKIWNIFPEGMFIDNVVEVAKRELSWEVDYVRERECTLKFKELLKPYPEYKVPDVVDELCSEQVFTTTFVEGVPVDKCVDMDEATRKHICYLVMQLCLRELFTFRYMQTDPNWSNFFYNPETRQLVLLDFGASRGYSSEFLDKYVEIIKAAADGDRAEVLRLSQQMGFLTGFESKIMEESHVDAVMILGEVFDKDAGEFDFGLQQTTGKIQKLVPTIITHRLCPPPEEIYSLHRKLSGVFLLCAKLKVKMACRQMFLDVYKSYKKGL